MNDFETGFIILFVLGLCVRQFVSRSNITGIAAISATLFGLMYVPVAAELHPENQFLPRRGRQILRPLFHRRDEIQRHWRVRRRLAHWPEQDDPANQPRQDVGGFRRRDPGFDGGERGVRAFFRRDK